MADPSLGLVMILKNEAANLSRSLAPIARLFDEIVVVDTGSADATPQICAELGARVHSFAWHDDFAAARNLAIAHATAQWLLWLDGDNSIDPEQLPALRQMLPGDTPAIIWAQELVTSTGARLWQKRCFPRGPEAYFHGRVHEQLIHPAHWPSLASGLVISHWGYEDPAAVRRKGAYYLKLLALTLSETPDDFYAHFQAARCHQNLRQFPEASEHLRQVVVSEQAATLNAGLWTQAHVDLSRLLERQGRHAEAARLLDGLLARLPRSGLALFQRGRLAQAMGNDELASVCFEQSLEYGLGAPVIDLDPAKTVMQANYFLAASRERLGDGDGAMAALRAALVVAPQNTNCRSQLARLLLAGGDAAEAAAQARAVLEFRPGDPTATRLLQACLKAA